LAVAFKINSSFHHVHDFKGQLNFLLHNARRMPWHQRFTVTSA
jgi:hypothetical protein